MRSLDTVVIGSGVAGQTVAVELAEAGRHVALVERRELGGTCALRGCEPKKTLFSAASTVERADGQSGHGVTGAIALNWPELIAFKAGFTDPVPASIESYLTSAGVTVISGEARFVGKNAIAVTGERFRAETFVVCTGSAPVNLGIPGEERLLDSEALMAAEQLGDHVVFVGGGLISFEFAHIAAAAGSQVTIVHRSSQVLKEFDSDLGSMLVDSYRERGVDVVLDAPVTAVREGSDGLIVELTNGRSIECDVAVHGAGRAPDLSALNLKAADVSYGNRGIEVDSSMRSMSNPRVFAAGDAAALGQPLTPVGVRQARVARANILEPGSDAYEPAVVGRVVFSAPPLASAGMTEREALASGLAVDVKLTDASGWASTRKEGAPTAGAKTIVERETGRILGVHLLGPNAHEVINVYVAAIAGGLSADDLKRIPWAYPTGAWDVHYLF